MQETTTAPEHSDTSAVTVFGDTNALIVRTLVVKREASGDGHDDALRLGTLPPLNDGAYSVSTAQHAPVSVTHLRASVPRVGDKVRLVVKGVDKVLYGDVVGVDGTALVVAESFDAGLGPDQTRLVRVALTQVRTLSVEQASRVRYLCGSRRGEELQLARSAHALAGTQIEARYATNALSWQPRYLVNIDAAGVATLDIGALLTNSSSVPVHIDSLVFSEQRSQLASNGGVQLARRVYQERAAYAQPAAAAMFGMPRGFGGGGPSSGGDRVETLALSDSDGAGGDGGAGDGPSGAEGVRWLADAAALPLVAEPGTTAHVPVTQLALDSKLKYVLDIDDVASAASNAPGFVETRVVRRLTLRADRILPAGPVALYEQESTSVAALARTPRSRSVHLDFAGAEAIGATLRIQTFSERTEQGRTKRVQRYTVRLEWGGANAASAPPIELWVRSADDGIERLAYDEQKLAESTGTHTSEREPLLANMSEAKRRVLHVFAVPLRGATSSAALEFKIETVTA